ncbi:MAG: response regulator transcription factor [Candidatus Eisenbacteria bacterium]
MTTRIVLADDHRMFRDGLRLLLEARPECAVVGEAEDGPTALELCISLRPDLVILDLSLPGLHGLEVARRLAREAPGTRVIVLTMHSDRRFVIEALRAGIAAYVLKESGFSELAHVLTEVRAGRIYLSPALNEQVLREYTQMADPNAGTAFSILTGREREVLQQVAEGRATKEIAAALGLSIKTVEAHRKQIMEKLDLHSVAELTKYALREGLTRLE